MNQKVKSVFREKANKAIAILLSFAMLLTMIPTFALKAKAEISTITVVLNKPHTTNATNTKYTFSNATVSDYSGITSITFSATNGTTVDSLPSSPTPSSILSSIDGTTRVYTYVFENGISSAAAQSFIRGVVFNYVAGAQISVTVDANKTVLPTGANITKFAPPDDTIHDHYYMFVPFSGTTALSWSEAYNTAKTYRYMGMVGYLATITSQDEDTILDNISMNGGWSGGSRCTGTYDGETAPNGTPDQEFKWACGPEKGQNYYYYDSSLQKHSENGAYNGFKDAGEPNNFDSGGSESFSYGNCEWCMQIHHLNGNGIYTWNDLSDQSTTKYVTGYFVEFSNYSGGMDENYASDKTAVNLYNLGTEGITTTPSIAVALNKPLTTDTTNTKYTFNNATVTSNDSITSITFTGTNSTTIASIPTAPAPTSCLSSIDGTTRVYTYVFSGITSAQAQSFIREVVLNYVAGAEISVTVDANKTNLPSGAAITTFAHPDGSNHYYMYVPSDLISWTDAYNDAKGYTYMGMKGYLATVTSEQEDDILRNISTISAWSAGTRLLDFNSAKFLNPGSVSLTSNYADYYYWACGPEAGTIFYDGITASSHNGPSYTGYNDAYNNWGTTQPDAYGGTETCVQVNWPFDTATTDMRWNDLPNEGLPELGLVKGYFVEFSNYLGGMDNTYSSDKTAVNLYNTGTSDITKTGAVTLNTPADLQYDGKAKACTADITGVTLVSGSDYTLTYKGKNGTDYSDSTTPPKNTGDYSVTFVLTAAGQAKCSTTGTLTVNFTITPATLTVTPTSSQSKLFGTADPSITYTYNGNVSGELPAFSGALSRDTGESIGNYGITQGNLALASGTGGFLASNYTLAFSSTTVNFAVTDYNPTERATLSSPNGDNGWFKDGGTDITLTAPTGFTISTTGTGNWANTISVDQMDGIGKNAAYYLKRTSDGAISASLTSDSYQVDTAAPVISSVDGNPSSWTGGNVALTVTATDSTSDLAAEPYSFDGGATWQASNSKSFSSNQKVDIRVKDNAGNISAATTVAITKIDKSGPVISSVDGNPSNWSNNDVTLAITAADFTSGLAAEPYSFDGGMTWQAGNSKSFSSNQTVDIKVKSSTGTISATTVEITKIDKAAPSGLTISYGSDNFKKFLNTITFGLFFKDTVTVTLTATDAGSGVKEFKYTVGGTEYTVAATGGSTTFAISPQFKGNISGVKAIDNAGNESAENATEYFAVDHQNPTAPTINPNSYVPGAWTNNDVKLTASGAIATSGIAKYQYSTDNGASWSDMTTTEKSDATTTDPFNVTKAELTISGNMNGSVLVRAVSNAGFVGDSKSVPVKFFSDALKEVIKDIDNLPDSCSAPDKEITDNEQAIKDSKILFDTLSKDEQSAVGQPRIDKLNQLIGRLNALLVIIPKDTDTGITAGNIATSVQLPELNDPNVGKVVVKLAVDPVTPSGTQHANIAIASTSLGQSGTNLLAAFDVSLIKSVFDAAGNQTSSGKVSNANITGPITILIPVPAGYQGRTDLQVVYIDDNGNVTPLTTTLVTVDGVAYLQFTTTHFSVYAVTAPDKTSSVPNPKTGNQTLPVPLFDIALLSVSAAIILRGRKNKNHKTSK